jgi:hypothetical protein
MANSETPITPSWIRRPTKAPSRGSFWLPDLSTRRGATRAAEGAAVSYGLMALGYVVAVVLILLNVDSPLTRTSAKELTVGIDLAVAFFAALMTWWAAARPGYIKTTFALLWVCLEVWWKFKLLGAGVIAGSWTQFLAIACAINSYRGIAALKKLNRAGDPAEVF